MEHKPAKVCLGLASISLNFWSLNVRFHLYKVRVQQVGAQSQQSHYSQCEWLKDHNRWMQPYLFAFCSDSHKREDFPFSWFFSACPVFLCYAPVHRLLKNNKEKKNNLKGVVKEGVHYTPSHFHAGFFLQHAHVC